MNLTQSPLYFVASPGLRPCLAILLLFLVPTILVANPAARAGVQVVEAAARLPGVASREATEQMTQTAANRTAAMTVARSLTDLSAESAARGAAQSSRNGSPLTVRILEDTRPKTTLQLNSTAESLLVAPVATKTSARVAASRTWWKEALALPVGIGAGLALHDLPKSSGPVAWAVSGSILGISALVGLALYMSIRRFLHRLRPVPIRGSRSTQQRKNLRRKSRR